MFCNRNQRRSRGAVRVVETGMVLDHRKCDLITDYETSQANFDHFVVQAEWCWYWDWGWTICECRIQVRDRMSKICFCLNVVIFCLLNLNNLNFRREEPKPAPGGDRRSLGGTGGARGERDMGDSGGMDNWRRKEAKKE